MALGASITMVGCSLFSPPPSKVRSGVLFETAHPKYDPYFRDVYGMQTDAKNWPTQKRAARNPLVDALKLDPDAVDVTLIQSTHERVLSMVHEVGTIRLEVNEGQGHVVAQNPAKLDDSGRAFFQAIEACVHNEAERAKSLRDVPARADALAKQGRELQTQAKDDLSRRGGRSAQQVVEELEASVDVVNEISKSSRLDVREADDFIADLRRAVGSEFNDVRGGGSNKAAGAKPKPKANAPSPGPSPSPAPAAPAAKPEPKPEPKATEPAAKPKPKPAADEFTP